MVDSLSADDRFATARVAVLGTHRPDGSPRLVPVTFVAHGDSVLIAVDHKPKTTRSLARLTDIAADPRVTMLAQHYADDWSQLWWVRADGIAEVRDKPTQAELSLLAAKYPQYHEHPPAGPVIDIIVTDWTQWTAGG